MSSGEAEQFPNESEGQRIGRLGVKCFRANIPNSWIEDSSDGDNDYGYDFQIQLERQGLVKDIFRAQLKSFTSPQTSADGENFFVSLEIKTVNYYARATEPVMLVVCDLSADKDNPKNCPIYYKWISEELSRLAKKEHRAGQQSITFHVPRKNKIHPDTDITGDIDRFAKIAKAAEQLDFVVAQDRPMSSSDERAEILAKLPQGLARRSAALIDVIGDDTASSWIEAPEGSLQWHLRSAISAIRVGNVSDAWVALSAAKKLLTDNSKPLERADYRHACGSVLAFEGKDSDAQEAFGKACELSDDATKHLVPWAESFLRANFKVEGKNDFSEVINRLVSSDHPVVAIKARLLAAERRFEEAIEVCKLAPDLEGAVARAVIFSMQGKTDNTIEVCNEGLLNKEAKENSRVIFLLLRARARFWIALGVKFEEHKDVEIPMTGSVSTDVEKLGGAWTDILEVLPLLRKQGWPGNVGLLADVWPVTASILGCQRETLPLLEEAASRRPSIDLLQSGLESIAVQSGDLKAALKANERQGNDEGAELRRVVLLSMDKRPHDSVKIMLSVQEKNLVVTRKYAFALGSAILAADRILRADLVRRWLDVLGASDEGRAQEAITKFILAKRENILNLEKALAELESRYQELGEPEVIAAQLLGELNPSVLNQAATVVEVAKKISSKRLLDLDESLVLAQALSTLGSWEGLLELSNSAAAQFKNSDQLVAVGAIALDRLGRTSEAHARLSALIANSNVSNLALNVYVSIASRIGFTAEAIACLERIFANEERRERKLECLRNLFGLIHLSEPASSRLLDVAWRIGNIVQQEDESEEGMFLMGVITATLSENVAFPEEKKAEFQRRVDAFTERFPESKVLRRVNLSEKMSPEELIATLDSLTGSSEEQRTARQKLQRELKNGMAPLPYPWRPQHVLDGVFDLPSLWEISKTSRWDDFQLHLTMAREDWTRASARDVRAGIPIVEFTALLVLFDLGILNKLFEIFPKIAIAKETLLEIQRLQSTPFGSLHRTKMAALQQILRNHLEKILQPEAELLDDDPRKLLFWSTEETIQAARKSEYTFYSDDAFLRVYSELPHGIRSICTLDVLIAMDEGDFISAREVAEHIATLTAWRVQLVVPIRYQIAILPEALVLAPNIAAGARLIREDRMSWTLFSGLWDPRKKYVDIQGHGGYLLGEMLSNPGNRVASVASLLAIWLDKAELHKDSPVPMERILALLIAQGASNSKEWDKRKARELWEVFERLVEYKYEQQMDEAKLWAAIEIAGRVAAELDIKHNLHEGGSIRNRFALGLTEGASEEERFTRSYTSRRIELERERLPK